MFAPPSPASIASTTGHGWTGAWATAPQHPTAGPFGPNWSVAGFTGQSVRQIVRAGIGGSHLRIRLSNAYGTGPLRLTGATIARTGDRASVRPGSIRTLTFHGSPSGVIPAGRQTASDELRFPVSPLERLTVTLYFAEPTGPATFHMFATATAYRASGDQRYDTGGAFDPSDTSTSSYFLTGIDVHGEPGRGTVVAFGDSITDGVGSSTDADDRYPDELTERLAAARRPASVLNTGIGGNRLLNGSPCFGDAAVTRFRRDVLQQPRPRTAIVLLGINDILSNDYDGSGCYNPRPTVTARQIIDGHRRLIRDGHARGIRMIGATLTPYEGFPHYTAAGERLRAQVNRWIRTSGEYDAVVDFDRAVADPADPGRNRIRAAYDSGDHLHPNDAGYRAMAAAVDPRTL
ncbi:SGNH/GDSL hydrolase family protein [Actinomadura fibrosa]|uniref:SGNH/GDSL hydrolase family protein n=1 Tax=Actinomadura fibrosa TaxID=111802 RepID=A0ABW2Y091_9ACTN|nr:SGNH/GDSL hydrolase family protein [Actinomadura fibrosa]